MPAASETAPDLRHFLDLDRLEAGTLRRILEAAKALKAARGDRPKGAVDPRPALAGHSLLMIFESASTRTRVSFEVAMRQLGGTAIDLEGQRMQLGRGESLADTARALSLYGDGLLLRSRAHANLLELARHAGVPVINALTDRSHPCQLMADVMTIEERLGPIAGTPVAWVGDGNNVAVSLIHAARRFDFPLRLACPPGYGPEEREIAAAREAGADLRLVTSPEEAVAGAAAVYTDTWRSMGRERDEDALEAFSGYRVTPDLMARAAAAAIFLHCLPAHRGQEVDSAVLDGPQSAVWTQAENRLHAQKAILRWCFGALADPGATAEAQ